MSQLNFIDLFAGAGGLSEGFIREMFEPVAHVEMNPENSIPLLKINKQTKYLCFIFKRRNLQK